MVKNGEFFMIKDMKQRGMSITAIAKEIGRDRKTIRKWLSIWKRITELLRNPESWTRTNRM
jgi:transposase